MAAEGALPNLIVIGAMKCGTTALHEYLALHPQIQMSKPKELNFFLDPEDYDPDPFINDESENAFVLSYRNWDRGTDWYRTYFSPSAPIRGESSVAYGFPWYPGVAERMASVVPDARLVYLVRDPIERIISHYHQNVLGGIERRSFAEAVLADRNPYLGPTRYRAVLAPFLERFPRERLFVVRSESLRDDRRGTMRQVLSFLGVDEEFWSGALLEARNETTEWRWQAPEKVKPWRGRLVDRGRRSRLADLARRRLPESVRERIRRRNTQLAGRARPRPRPALRRRLIEELEPEIAAIEKLTGWDLREWKSAEPDRSGS